MRGAPETSRGARASARAVTGVMLLLTTFAVACRQDMHDAPRYDPLEASDFFADGRASRDFVEGTVARGQLRAEEAFYTGKQGGAPVAELPVPLTRELVARGRERFDIYCSPCHGRTGEGNGVVVQRGYKQPTSFHDPRLRGMPVGYFFDVMTNGFGQMPDYSAQVAPRDRWAIATYVRALQLSRGGTVADVPAAERSKLEGGPSRDPGQSHQEGPPAHD